MAKQTTYLGITPKGERYFQQLVDVGYPNLHSEKRAEWDILHDLMLLGGPVAMSPFLVGGDTILGRAFAHLSERPRGQLIIEGYGKTLHSLIKQGYIGAFRKEPE